ncbi:hypothetical protein H1R20_g10776, partial [Candolleomyces eurysporus]
MVTQGMSASADHVAEAVLQDSEISSHMLVCETLQFIDRFLAPADDELFNAILQDMEQEGFYTSCRWNGLAENPGELESAHYVPIASIANGVFMSIVNRGRKPADSIQSIWLNRSSAVSASTDPNTAKIRADLNCLIGSADTEHLLLKSIFVSWIKTLCVLEVKSWNPRDPEDKDWSVLDRETVLQLMTYMRCTLREQQDRRFVFGMTLFHRSLSVWYGDRQGVIGTATPIDIDQNPLLFIRVIASFSLLSPEKLGYDPTMKLVLRPDPLDRSRPVGPVESYSHTLWESHLPVSRHEICWEIIIAGKRYRTVKPLSDSRSEEMCGRATLVWLGLRIEDQEVIVIKQSWRPSGEGTMSEFELYEKAKAGESKCLPTPLAHETLSESSTAVRRNGLKLVPVRFSKTKKGYGEVADETMVYHVPEPVPGGQQRESIERTLDRIVLEGYGWPIKFFKDLRELLTVYLDVLRAYEHLYNNGLCHRDISPGNIMITFDEASNTVGGWLIDLDHAKYQENYKPETIAEFTSRLSARPEYTTLIAQVTEFAKTPIFSQQRPTPDHLLITFLAWISRKPDSKIDAQHAILCFYHFSTLFDLLPNPPAGTSVSLSDFGINPEVTIFSSVFGTILY